MFVSCVFVMLLLNVFRCLFNGCSVSFPFVCCCQFVFVFVVLSVSDDMFMCVVLFRVFVFFGCCLAVMFVCLCCCLAVIVFGCIFVC